MNYSVSNTINVYADGNNMNSSFKGYMETNENEYTGISNIKKKSEKSNFLERFQGR